MIKTEAVDYSALTLLQRNRIFIAKKIEKYLFFCKKYLLLHPEK